MSEGPGERRPWAGMGLLWVAWLIAVAIAYFCQFKPFALAVLSKLTG